MVKKCRKFPFLIVLSMLPMLLACASQFASQGRVDQKLPAGSKIGILPFENLSGTEFAGEIITEYFHSQATTIDRWLTVEYGEVYDGMRNLRIRSASAVTNDQLRKLAGSVGLEYVLTGSVLEYEEHDNSYLGRLPQVSFTCRLRQCSTGKTVWVGTSNGRGDRGEIVFGVGAVRSAEELSRKMVQEAVDALAGLFLER